MSRFDALFPWRSHDKQLKVLKMDIDNLDEKINKYADNLIAAKAVILAKIDELKAALGQVPPDVLVALVRLEAAVNDQLNIVSDELRSAVASIQATAGWRWEYV